MADPGHIETEAYLRMIEAQVKDVYKQAAEETEAKLKDYLDRFKAKDSIKQELVKEGKITQAEYTKWRTGQIMIGKRWSEMRDTLAADFVNADKIAASIVNGYMPDVYALNHNYATFEVEKGALVDTSYTLYDRQTVERLIRDQPDLLPQVKINDGEDWTWYRRQVTAATTQGILQGESLDKIAKRMGATVSGFGDRAAIRNARTSMTGAQNAGRVDGYKRAQGMGIDMQQEWVATLDARTRDSHAVMDGERIEVGKKFSNGCRYPGDPAGPPAEVWNCRCTIVAALKGFETGNEGRFSRLEDEEETYDEWKARHQKSIDEREARRRDKSYEISMPTLQARIGAAKTVQDINDIMNSQGWFRSTTKNTNPRYDMSQHKWVYDTETVQSMADLTGCDLDSAKAIASGYQRVFERYPQLIGKLDAVDAHPAGMADNTYAWCYSKSGGRVQVNPRLFSDWKKVQSMYDRDVLVNWHPQGTTAESIVIHEIGHGVDGLLASQGVMGGYTASGAFRYASSSLRERVMKKCGLTVGDTASNVSVYGAKNAQEWFAECFAESTTSASPRKVATEFGRQLEQLLGGVK